MKERPQSVHTLVRLTLFTPVKRAPIFYNVCWTPTQSFPTHIFLRFTRQSALRFLCSRSPSFVGQRLSGATLAFACPALIAAAPHVSVPMLPRPRELGQTKQQQFSHRRLAFDRQRIPLVSAERNRANLTRYRQQCDRLLLANALL